MEFTLLDRLADLIAEAAPLTWAATEDTSAAVAWEKRAVTMLAEIRSTAEDMPKRYRHFKGGIYTVIGHAEMMTGLLPNATPIRVVIYRKTDPVDRHVYARTEYDWTEPVVSFDGAGFEPRFTPVADEGPRSP